MNEIENMLCIENVANYAALKPLEASPFFLQPEDVLFNRTNSQEWVGRTGIFKPFLAADQPIFASYLIRLWSSGLIKTYKLFFCYLATNFMSVSYDKDVDR
jgi:type I restriction enzyme S subunit